MFLQRVLEAPGGRKRGTRTCIREEHRVVGRDSEGNLQVFREGDVFRKDVG